MHAIVFMAKAKDGIIEIPSEYLENLKNEFRVIILIEPKGEKVASKKPAFTSLEIDTKGFKFDREEANKR